ncbi:MAG: metallopeptidase TldD-related protein [Candidatus Cloacimonetes bacterium]|nr:metallopeptidase TldD-related protein [Candidatus Cloacimonadota bacterium]
MNSKLKKIVQYVEKNCQADDFTLNIFLEDSHETRFAQNAVTQHIAGANLSISLEVAFDNKTGSCEVNQDSPETLAYLIKTAEDMAKLNQPDPEYVASAAKQKFTSYESAAAATKELSPERMIEIVKDSIRNAEKQEAKVSGMTEKHLYEHFLATKNGFRGSYESGSFGHSMTIIKADVETKISCTHKDFASFKLKDELKKLNAQFSGLSSPQNFDAQKIAVILRPEALMELLWFMCWMMNRRESDEGLTPFSDQLGKRFFGKDFSMYSTLKNNELSCAPFSGDGIISEDRTWIEKGKLVNMPCNCFWAQKIGEKPSRLFNIYIPGGKSSEAEMMKKVPKGLIINRFWYIRTVDMKKGELTGMTRDGVLYFENGKIKHAVNNLRFNEIPHDMTKRILALGTNQVVESYLDLPTMLIDGFNFVDKTSF